MTEIVKTGKPLATRLRDKLRTKYGMGTGLPSTSCLLLDLSYSMDNPLGPNDCRSRLSELRVLAQDFTDVRRFIFACSCYEMKPHEFIGEANGGTNLAGAFLHVKQAGITHVVLITDGEPDDEAFASRASEGLQVDCFYVGPDPAPDFLRRLAVGSGGSYGRASMTSLRELRSSVRERLQLSAPSEVIKL